MLSSVSDNDLRLNAFAPTQWVLCVGFLWQMVKICMIRLRGVEGQNARDQTASYTFHSFLVEAPMNAC